MSVIEILLEFILGNTSEYLACQHSKIFTSFPHIKQFITEAL